MSEVQYTMQAIAPRYYPWAVRLDTMVQRAADAIAVSPATLLGNHSARHIVRARWAVMAALRNADWSLTRIGRAIGGRDHTTVMHGLREGEKLRATDRDFAELCEWVAG